MSQPVPPAETSGPRLVFVLGTIAFLAVLLGVLAFASYSRSEVVLQETFQTFDRKGLTLEAEQCVDEALKWNTQCAAMKSLCDQAVPMVTHHCLQAKDRSAYCQALGEEHHKAQWTFQKCQEHAGSRRAKNLCTDAYRALATFCKSEGQGVLL